MRLFIALSGLICLTLAKTIRFFKGDGCDHNEDPIVQCGNINIPGCCTADAPFCKFLECIDCTVGNDVYSYDQRRCDISSKSSCRIGADAECCVGAGGGNTCAGNWFVGGAGAKVGPAAADAVIAEFNGSEPVPWELLPKMQELSLTGRPLPSRCAGILEPNSLIYSDGDGIIHSKHMPRGTYRRSMKYLGEHNWAELAKLPVWDNQTYTVDDYTLK